MLHTCPEPRSGILIAVHARAGSRGAEATENPRQEAGQNLLPGRLDTLRVGGASAVTISGGSGLEAENHELALLNAAFVQSHQLLTTKHLPWTSHHTAAANTKGGVTIVFNFNFNEPSSLLNWFTSRVTALEPAESAGNAINPTTGQFTITPATSPSARVLGLGTI
ncbi:hypothetical protein DFH09DRAFT_1285973 [Mycena vulgaris]|nr:hypothetical protein DFH09DRAFT_1285973 [Mycena vulgaris]